MTVRALFFDVFGTLVDWRAGVARDVEALLRPLGELTLTTYPLVGLSQLAGIDGDYARARALIEEGLAIRRQPDYGYPWLVAIALIHLGEIDRCAGDPAHGLPFFEQALATGREVADDVLIGYSVHNLGHVALHTGDLSTAAAYFREGLLVRWRSGPGAEIAASIMDGAFLSLEAPIRRVAAYDVPFVGFAREKASVPDVARVLAAARETLAF